MVRCVVCGMRPPCRGLSFHSFPMKDKELLEKWLAVVPRKNFQATYHTKICSRHFLESSYLKGYVNKKQLKNDAVPILNTDLQPDINTCKVDEKSVKIENEVENTPVITSHDHAYCKGKASKRNNENKGKNNRKNQKDNDENELKEEKPMKTNQGILTDTSQHETLKFTEKVKVKVKKLPHLEALPTNILDSPEEDFTSTCSNNDTANNNISNKVTNNNIMNKVPPTNITPPHYNSDHIYNRSLSMIEKQESILKRKENSIKKLRKKLMNSERKSRRQALKIKELKELIVELMVKNKEKSCADCSVGNHFLCHSVKPEFFLTEK